MQPFAVLKRWAPSRGRSFDCQVGRYCLTFPKDHRFAEYQSRWKRYDVPLGEVARVTREKYLTLTALDIGANIGVAAAVICTHGDVPVLCVEGNPAFLPWLRQNVSVLGSHIEVEAAFVAYGEIAVDPTRLATAHGTASIVGAIAARSGSAGHIATKSIEVVLEENPRFATAKLWKIDTDGLDFSIIVHGISLVAAKRPILFFEYDPSMSPGGAQVAREAIRALVEVGFSSFLVYDNFGNYMMSLTGAEIEKFDDLNCYLESNKRYGTAVYYLDVCAFPTEDTDVFHALRRSEIASASSG